MILSHDTDYTQVLFSSPISIVAANFDPTNQVDIKATTNIKTNELILVEHILGGSSFVIQNIVRGNTQLFNNLYPRNINNCERDSIADQKIKLNIFQNGEDFLILGNTISYFNHSCNPNAVALYYTLGQNDMVCVVVYAVRDISKHESISISYNPNTGHTLDKEEKNKRDFVCTCETTLEERTKLNETIRKKFIGYRNLKLKNIINTYTNSSIFRLKKLRYMLAKDGLYTNNEKDFLETVRFKEMMKQEYPGESIVKARQDYIESVRNQISSEIYVFNFD